MFEIDVMSDPGAATAYLTPMWDAEHRSLSKYDVDLVKPMLLFADKISLRSQREDMLAVVRGRIFVVQRMPMRRVFNYIGLCERRDPDELLVLGLPESALAPRAETDRVQTDMEQVPAFARQYDAQISDAANAIERVWSQREKQLSLEDLAPAVERDLVSVSGWRESGTDPWSLAWSDENDFFALAPDELIDQLVDRPNAVMFEPGSRMTLGDSLADGGTLIASPATQPLVSPISVAAALFARLPTMASVPVGELLEIRDDLHDYLAPFRAGMVDLAEQISSEPDLDEKAMAQRIERCWYRDIDPALQELRNKARNSGYPRQLLATFSEDKGSLIGATSSVVLAAGSLVAGVATLLPAMAAASVPFVRALNGRLKERDDLKGNRLYFLYKLQDRLR